MSGSSSPDFGFRVSAFGLRSLQFESGVSGFGPRLKLTGEREGASGTQTRYTPMVKPESLFKHKTPGTKNSSLVRFHTLGALRLLGAAGRFHVKTDLILSMNGNHYTNASIVLHIQVPGTHEV